MAEKSHSEGLGNMICPNDSVSNVLNPVMDECDWDTDEHHDPSSVLGHELEHERVSHD